MECPECGSANDETANFCFTCGYHLQSRTVSFEKPVTPKPQAILEPYRYRQSADYGALPPEVTDTGPIIDTTGFWNYLAALIFFPVGPVMWAYMRDRKPNSARNLLFTSIAGIFLWFFFVTGLSGA